MRPSFSLRAPVPPRAALLRWSCQRAVITTAAAGALLLARPFAGPTEGASVNTADTVIGYDLGDNLNPVYQDPTAALGELNGDTGFGGLTPFNPPFAGTDIAIIGAGGYLTLETEVPFSTTGYNLGVFVNNGIEDVSPDGSGRAASPPKLLSAAPKAKVSVSGDGVTWEYLDGGDVIEFDKPTNVYLDTDITEYFQPLGDVKADMGEPWVGSLSELAGLNYSQIREAFDGSAGGNWLNLDSLTLDEAQFVRFETDTEMVLDAIATTDAVPEPSAGLAILGGLCLMLKRRRAE